MIAQEAIAALDDALHQAGESVRLLRMATAPASGIASEVTCLALIRGYAPSELVAGTGIGQQDQKMIISPTPILMAGWPGGGGSPVPRQGDRIISNRGPLTIQDAAGFYVADVLVRIEIQARGS